ncbi:hypothetical protein LTR20_003409 [Exophiala xenobiotica]|nr:hypothetical protein LTS13_009171 [Exophiala xenobiotica]KAK5402608.1 hypothetical protein LTR79_001336 [Exophiala xenobiotica]KAK5418975.1 hypothetical protein LTR90_004038 [Exophiala xenobiotica]KAK5466462.1 hypothetical protein LTR20_003409 [Exophiala xenobiotica]KAK5484808.1 hypothetical protein LTR83_008633 [Exophiala xenobiotica]
MDPHHYGYRAPTRTVSDDTRTTSTVTSTLHGRAPQQPYVPFSSPSSSTPRTPIAPQTISAYPGATQQPPSRPFLPLAPQISSLPIPASLEPITRPPYRAPTSTFPTSTPQHRLSFTAPNREHPKIDEPSQHDHRTEPSFRAPIQTELPGISRPNSSRYSLHIRQQPRAARAGPDGKDRRPIDPPPILQLLMRDFDPDNADDVAEIKTQWWVVYCRLVAAENPSQDVSTVHYIRDDGRSEVQRLLLGTAVANPTITLDDPDPPTMPYHPTTPPPPQSPTIDRFIRPPSDRPVKQQRDPYKVPGCFFIFADISVRRAGDYRLQFTLMKMDPAYLHQGSTVPCVETTVSLPFRVVNAKDFDQVQPSTDLVKGLLARGAGFPLKLKKGNREGNKRRRHQSGDGSDEDSYYDENYD